ncbi:MAG: phosphoglucosamine mutase, partial [Pseudomonadota bacterium]
MSRQFFGTDGIRGRANMHPMTSEVALALGRAAGTYFSKGQHRHTVVIGKDTRRSGYMLEFALASGFVSVGMDVELLGPMPTPAVGMLTRTLRADLGVMISASHNPFEDNGIKLFGPDGFKLSDASESEIERLMAAEATLAVPGEIGRIRNLRDGRARKTRLRELDVP